MTSFIKHSHHFSAVVISAYVFSHMNPEGIEPPTFWLKASYSTIELRVQGGIVETPHILLAVNGKP